MHLMKATPASGLALAALSACCFGTGSAATKMLGDAGATPLEIARARLVVAALVLLVFTAVTRPRHLWPGWRAAGVAGVLGVVSYAGVQTLCGVSVARIPVGVFVVVQFTAPAMVVVWTRVIRRVRQPAPVWAGVVVVLAGLLLVGRVWSHLRLDAVGVLAALGAAAALSVRFLLAERALRGRDPVAVTTLAITAAASVLLATSPTAAFPYDVLTDITRYGELAVPVWAVVCWTAVVATGLACVSGIAAQRVLAPVRAGACASLEVVAGTAVAWLALGQTLTPLQLLGVAAVLAGVMLAQRAR
ncbi:DMT family transporter [Streptomyces sp. NPDC041068]|uniref:DMT family transporter n=1 Tax=Streptomyces sp. NPDC041068 TaxID=3155130 RepID=UPI0033C7635E